MNDETSQPIFGKRLKWLMGIGAALLLILLALGMYHDMLERGIKAKQDAIRKAGYPVTPAELDKWYAYPPPGENAADVYLDAFSHFDMTREDQAEKLGEPWPVPLFNHEIDPPPRTEPLPKNMIVASSDFLTDNAIVLQRLHEAAAFKQCRYPTDLNKGFACLLPHLQQLRSADKLLALQAILHAENNEGEAALESLMAALALSKSLKNEPILISHLVRIACRDLTIEATERTVNRTRLSDAQLVKLISRLSDCEDLDAMSRSYAGELCMQSNIHGRPFKEVWWGGSSYSASANDYVRHCAFLGYAAVGLKQLDYQFALDYLFDCVQAGRLPPHERLTKLTALESRVVTLPKYRVLARMFMPATARAAIVDVQSIARLRTARTALAAERFRLKYNRWPETLNQLVPEFIDVVPLDPFDGKTLRCKNRAAGFVVYSIGEDMTDDGGAEIQPATATASSTAPTTQPPGQDALDITFTIER